MIEFTRAGRTERAYGLTLLVAKGLALVGFGMVNNDKPFHKVCFVADAPCLPV